MGSRVWQTDGQTDTTAYSNSALYQPALKRYVRQTVCKKRDMTHRRKCYTVYAELYKTADKIWCWSRLGVSLLRHHYRRALDRQVPESSGLWRPSSTWLDDECGRAKQKQMSAPRRVRLLAATSTTSTHPLWCIWPPTTAQAYFALLRWKRHDYRTERVNVNQSRLCRLWWSFDELLGRSWLAPSESSRRLDWHPSLSSTTESLDAASLPPARRIRNLSSVPTPTVHSGVLISTWPLAGDRDHVASISSRVRGQRSEVSEWTGRDDADSTLLLHNEHYVGRYSISRSLCDETGYSPWSRTRSKPNSRVWCCLRMLMVAIKPCL